MNSNTMNSFIRTSAMLVTMLAPFSTSAKVGTVAFVMGSAHLEKAPEVPLVKQAGVDNGDAVVTGNNGRVQLRMIDGGKIAVRPDSVFRIENYSVTPDVVETSVVADTSSQKNAAVLNLLKGGFRTITGDAAGVSPESYQVKTPVATMGIRGTHYQVRLCTSDCANELPPGVNDSYRGPGLYVAVYEGRVWVESDGGRLEISSGEFIWVASLSDAPALLQRPSSVLYDDPVVVGKGPDDRGDDNKRLRKSNLRREPRDPNMPSNPSKSPANGDVPEPERQLTAEGGGVDVQTGGPSSNNAFRRSVAWGYGPNDTTGATTTAIRADNNNVQFAVDNNGNLTAFEGSIEGAAGPQAARFELGSATVTNTGQDPSTGLRWGRWAGGAATVTTAAATGSQNLEQSSLHWITSPITNQAPQIPTTGSANYQLIGNTNPTDNFGEIGLLGSATLQANFATQTVDSTVNIGIAGENWQASGSAALNNHLFAAQYNNVSVDGLPASGEFSGFLLPVDPAINSAVPAGAGLSYSLHATDTPRQPNGVSVTGTAAFGNP